MPPSLRTSPGARRRAAPGANCGPHPATSITVARGMHAAMARARARNLVVQATDQELHREIERGQRRTKVGHPPETQAAQRMDQSPRVVAQPLRFLLRQHFGRQPRLGRKQRLVCQARTNAESPSRSSKRHHSSSLSMRTPARDRWTSPGCTPIKAALVNSSRWRTSKPERDARAERVAGKVRLGEHRSRARAPRVGRLRPRNARPRGLRAARRGRKEPG